MNAFAKSLVILVADNNIKAALEGLLEHPEALCLRIASDEVDIFVHPFRDPGVYRRAPDFLRPYIRSYRYALVILDREGCGANGRDRKRKDTAKLQAEMRQSLERNGWKDRCEVIIIDPELEVWVWNGSPAMAPLLRINPEDWLSKCYRGEIKHPKEELERLLKERRIKRSSALYKNMAITLAKEDSRRLRECTDPAFQGLREALQKWFGEQENQKEEG